MSDFFSGGRLKIILVTLFAVSCLAPKNLSAQESVYNGAYVHNEGDLTSSADWNVIATYEGQCNKGLSIINFFIPWEYSTGFSDFPDSTLDAIRAHGSIPLLTWQPDGSGDSSEPDSTFTLTNIINGNFDSYISTWALAAKNWGNPFFMRFAHEMNGTWYPWSEAINGNSSGQYVLMWRHVHDIFTQTGATNVTWVWCVNTDFSGSVPITGLYPGDNYVDWISLDTYNRLANSWADFAGRSSNSLNEIIAIAPGKPIMIAETGCSEKAGNDKGQWLRSAMTNYLPVMMPRIKAWCYFNNTNEQDGNDWRITTSSNALLGYQDGIGFITNGVPYYSSNEYGAISNSPIQPLLNDALGVDKMGPFVSIVTPAVNHVRTGSRVVFQALASDKSGIDKILFYTNGVLARTENLDPYQYFWTAPTNAGQTTTVMAKAYDLAGNTTISTIQVVSQDAVVVNLTNSDVSGTTSFNTAGNWDSGQLPMTGNDYVVGSGLVFRTPTDNGVYTFSGDSLTLAGTFNFKQTNLITVGNLILTNGVIVNAFAGGTPDVGLLAGNITVITNGSIDAGGNAGASTYMQILSTISGNGGLTIRKPSVVTLGASNTYNGPLLLQGTTLEISSNASIAPSSLTLQNYAVSGSLTNEYVTNIVRAGGSLNISGGTNGVLRVGYRSAAGTNCVAVLDVSSQSQFSVNVGEFSAGINLFNDSFITVGSLLLATNNTVSATNVLIGDSTFTGSMTTTNAVLLGAGSNYFMTPLMTIGGRKANTKFTLPVGGTFRLDNGSAKTDLTVAGENFSTSVSSVGIADLSGGAFVGNIGSLIVGQKLGGSSGGATGILTLGNNSANNLTANTALIGSMTAATSSSPVASGVFTMSGGSCVVNSNVTLGSFSGSFGSAQGILNINGGAFTAGGDIVNGGGTGIVNVSGGNLTLSRKAGTVGSPLTALNLTNATLHLNLNGSPVITNIVATTIGSSGVTIITIDSVTNFSSATVFPLMSYIGANPYANLSLAALPAGFSGTLVNNTTNKRIDLSVVSSVTPTSPTILPPAFSGTNFTLRVNSQSGFNYLLQVTPQLTPSSWATIQTKAGGGTLSFTVPISATNSQQFFRVRVQ